MSNVKAGWGINKGRAGDEEEVKSRAPKLVFKELQAGGGRYVNLGKEGEKSRGWSIPLGGRLTFAGLFGRRWPSAEPRTASGDQDRVRREEPGLQLRGPCRACPSEVCGPLGHRRTREAPLRAAQPLHARIDLSCMPVAPEVLPAFRDPLHPTQPTHSFPARSLPSLLDPWMEVRATGGEEEDESPRQ